ncbi:FMN-binding negative transcriptional regulator [Lysinibacillus sp. NPDC097287]|uniref:FMN-binding negative transcriptional regulator n=1 Tax=Lysinibacillus sp. NPDC097287 TaxID=3364144 RepID=UPI0037FC9549
MYIPKAFRVTDQVQLIKFIEQNSFGILFSQLNAEPFATHLPFVVEENCLLSHFAIANPQWQHLDGQQVLVVFHGPHAYISPTWYQEENTVPTWNYTAVHVVGKVKVVKESERLQDILEKTIHFNEQFETNPWQANFDAKAISGMMNGIVGVEVNIESIEGKWKMNQHHPVKRQQNAIEGLMQSPQIYAKQVAKLMKKNVEKF